LLKKKPATVVYNTFFTCLERSFAPADDEVVSICLGGSWIIVSRIPYPDKSGRYREGLWSHGLRDAVKPHKPKPPLSDVPGVGVGIGIGIGISVFWIQVLARLLACPLARSLLLTCLAAMLKHIRQMGEFYDFP